MGYVIATLVAVIFVFMSLSMYVCSHTYYDELVSTRSTKLRTAEMETQLENRWNAILPVPFVNKVGLVFLGILNCIIPGLGLALATCLYLGKVNSYFLIIALCQFIMAFIVIGWIWAIVNGIFMIVMPFSPSYDERKQKYDEECRRNATGVANAEVQQPENNQIQQA